MHRLLHLDLIDLDFAQRGFELQVHGKHITVIDILALRGCVNIEGEKEGIRRGRE